MLKELALVLGELLPEYEFAIIPGGNKMVVYKFNDCEEASRGTIYRAFTTFCSIHITKENSYYDTEYNLVDPDFLDDIVNGIIIADLMKSEDNVRSYFFLRC